MYLSDSHALFRSRPLVRMCRACRGAWYKMLYLDTHGFNLLRTDPRKQCLDLGPLNFLLRSRASERWSHCGGHGGSWRADQMAAGGELAAGILVKRPRQRSRLHALISSAANTASERWRAWKKAEAARRPACAARPMCGARFGGTHGGHLCGTDTHDLRVPRACAPPSWHSSAAC